MPKAAKIAISLPDKLLRAAERKRKATRETRSQFFRRAVETLLHKEQERADIAQYVRSYREHPETAEEIEQARRQSKRGFDANPWK